LEKWITSRVVYKKYQKSSKIGGKLAEKTAKFHWSAIFFSEGDQLDISKTGLIKFFLGRSNFIG
jgi:hypothetical protein